MSSVLTITEDTVIPINVAVDACKGFGEDLNIITNASSLTEIPFDSSSIDAVVCVSKSEDFPGDPLLSEICRVLTPGGTVLVHSPLHWIANVVRTLLLNGFVEAEPCNPNRAGVATGVRAKRPSWDIGTSFELKKSSDKQTVVNEDEDEDADEYEDEDEDEDDELIDEDTLLTEDDLKKPEVVPNDCEVGSAKKACKNCSCGRAEAEEKVKLGLTMDQINNPTSACGSCGLGDAFRCGTCPYKGLPPFELGDKISISASFLAADI